MEYQILNQSGRENNRPWVKSEEELFVEWVIKKVFRELDPELRDLEKRITALERRGSQMQTQTSQSFQQRRTGKDTRENKDKEAQTTVISEKPESKPNTPL